MPNSFYKPPLTWVPAPNFGIPRGTFGRVHISAIILHILNVPLEEYDALITGKAYRTKAEMRHPSVHFAISPEGQIHQYVNELDAAWGLWDYDAGNFPSAYVSGGWTPLYSGSPDLYALHVAATTEVNLDAMARLVAYLCHTYSIPVDLAHITVHENVDAQFVGECDTLPLSPLLSEVAAIISAGGFPSTPLLIAHGFTHSNGDDPIPGISGAVNADNPLSGDGTPTHHLGLALSPDAGNELSIHTNGLFSQNTSFSPPITPVDSSTLHLATSGVNQHTLTGAVKVSAQSQNAITENADGIYAPVVSGTGVPSDSVVSETSYGQSAGAGVATTYARGDHTHGSPTAPSVPSPASSVVPETSFGQSSAVGSSTNYARQDHTHGSPTAPSVPVAGNTVISETSFGQSSSAGAATTFSRSDHTHGSPTSPTAVGVPPGGTANQVLAKIDSTDFNTQWVNQSVTYSTTVVNETTFGQSANAGVVNTVARGDHTHGSPTAPSVPSPASSVVPETSFGQSSAVGSSTNYARGDHTHGSPTAPSGTGVPSDSVVSETSYGQSAGAGVATTYARGDHTHGSPTAPTVPGAGNTVTNETVYGLTPSAGSSTSYSRVDHTHGSPTSPVIPSGGNTVVGETSYGQSSAAGSATTFSRSDHTHGSPPAPTASSITLAGDVAGPGNATVVTQASGAFAFTGILTPPVITGDQNDYNPAGLATAGVLVLAASTSHQLTGLATGTPGRIITLLNNGSALITLSANNTSSALANRFGFTADLLLGAGFAQVLQYVNGWHALDRGEGDLILGFPVQPLVPLNTYALLFNGSAWTPRQIQYSDIANAPANLKHQALFTFEGVLSARTGTIRIYNKQGATVTISQVFIAVNTPPSGGVISVDILKNGTSIFTNPAHQPFIGSGNNTGFTTTIDVPAWADGDYLTANILTVGSSIPGSDLTIHVIYS